MFMSKKKEKPKFIIEQVPELPIVKRGKRESVYDILLKDIVSRSGKYFKITIPDKKPRNIYMMLNKRIKQEKLKLKVYLRKNQCYVEKLD